MEKGASSAPSPLPAYPLLFRSEKIGTATARPNYKSVRLPSSSVQKGLMSAISLPNYKSVRLPFSCFALAAAFFDPTPYLLFSSPSVSSDPSPHFTVALSRKLPSCRNTRARRELAFTQDMKGNNWRGSLFTNEQKRESRDETILVCRAQDMQYPSDRFHIGAQQC